MIINIVQPKNAQKSLSYKMHFHSISDCATPKLHNKTKLLMETQRFRKKTNTQVLLKSFNSLMRWCFNVLLYRGILQKCYGDTFFTLRFDGYVRVHVISLLQSEHPVLCLTKEKTEYPS